MRDIVSISARLVDALAIFPHFSVIWSDAPFGGEPYIVVQNSKEIGPFALADDYQEFLITKDSVELVGPMRDDVGNHPFKANGEWFAVTAIIFAVLSGRE